MDLVKALSSQYMKPELPEMKVGDTVRVHVRIKEGSRERIQVFEGTIIARKHGGIGETITVRRFPTALAARRFSLCILPMLLWLRPSVRVRSAAQSCTTCATARQGCKGQGEGLIYKPIKGEGRPSPFILSVSKIHS